MKPDPSTLRLMLRSTLGLALFFVLPLTSSRAASIRATQHLIKPISQETQAPGQQLPSDVALAEAFRPSIAGEAVTASCPRSPLQPNEDLRAAGEGHGRDYL